MLKSYISILPKELDRFVMKILRGVIRILWTTLETGILRGKILQCIQNEYYAWEKFFFKIVGCKKENLPVDCLIVMFHSWKDGPV